ncbi:MAG: response regulator [Magnetococcales bacterium]|nr:response regulator [Magnetococcales bacterium]
MAKLGVGVARILVIDDDPTVRELLRMVLEAEGHRVVEASDGQMGVDLYCNVPPDLIITDINMPRMDGIEVIAEVKNRSPHAKIIVMSSGGKGLDAQFTLAVAADFGVRDAIAKPFTSLEVLAAVREMLA